MQFKADRTKEELINSALDPLFETHFPIGKLKSVAELLEGYSPDCGLDESIKSLLISTAHIVEDAANEIEYLIEVSDEQYYQRKKEGCHEKSK